MMSNNEKKIDAIAEQWVNLVLAHVRAKKLIKTKLSKKKYKMPKAKQP